MSPIPDQPDRPTPIAPVLRFVRQFAVHTQQTDGELLARYSQTHDEAAFEELVRRHGPMVLAVCRRVLLHAADAEDATQAAFFVLAKQATRFTERPTIGDWLHGVATRTAWKARSRRTRRHQIESAAARPDSTPPHHYDDTSAAVDRAVRALPHKLRSVVVLCELQGTPRAVAAQQLGIPIGTVASRLAAARTILARRLGPLTTVSAAASLPAHLAEAVCQVSTGTAPAHVTFLALDVSRMLTLFKVRVAIACVAIAATLTSGSVLLLRQAEADEPGKAKKLDGDQHQVTADNGMDKKAQQFYALYEQLSGVWQLSIASVDGEQVEHTYGMYPKYAIIGRPSYPIGCRIKLFVEANQFFNAEGGIAEIYSCKINTRRNHNELTMTTGKWNEIFGPSFEINNYIYELKNEQLTLCTYAEKSYPDRPHGFAPEEQPAGSPPLLLLNYKRNKKDTDGHW